MLKHHFVVLHRYDFRKRVASVLQVEMGRITILGDSPSSAADGHCQKVSFMISGNTKYFIFYLHLQSHTSSEEERNCVPRIPAVVRIGRSQALRLFLNPPLSRNLVLLFIVIIGLFICGREEEGSVSAEGSHTYSQMSPTCRAIIRLTGCSQSTDTLIRRTGIRSIRCSPLLLLLQIKSQHNNI